MKKRHSFYKYVLAIIFMMSGAQTLLAQDAFYIYRNDGDFDGFFYDQIVRMSYSKTDLEGEEHDVFVVQEIETTDSLYRIPLAAIDSIGFQQPEIRLNPKLKVINSCGLQPYLQSADMHGMTVYFQNLPTALIPQKGDVLVGYDDGDETSDKYYGDNSFGGVVTGYQIVDNITMVYCDPLSDLNQVFDQFISVEQVGTDSQGNVRRRLAGFNEDGFMRSASRRLNGNFNVSLIDWSGRLTLADNSSDNSKMSIGIDIGFNVKTTLVYAITGIIKKRFFVKAMLSEEFSAALSGEVKLQGEKQWDYDPFMGLAPAFKFPSFLPIFEIAPYPKGFIQIHGDFSTKLKMPSFKVGMTQTLIMDTEDPWFISVKWGDRDKQYEGYKLVESDFDWFNLGMSFNGWLYAGSYLPVYLSTNSWIKKLVDARIGMGFHAGPKISGSLALDLTHGDDDYLALKDSKIEVDIFSVTSEAGASSEVMGSEKIERTIWETEKKYGAFEWYLFPDFIKANAKYNLNRHTYKDAQGEPYYQDEITSVDYTVFPRRQVFMPLNLGVGVYYSQTGETDTYKLIETRWHDEQYSMTNNYIYYTINIPCKGRAQGYYFIKPLIKCFDDIIQLNILIPSDLNTDYHSFKVEEDGCAWK